MVLGRKRFVDGGRGPAYGGPGAGMGAPGAQETHGQAGPGHGPAQTAPVAKARGQAGGRAHGLVFGQGACRTSR